MLRNEIQVAAPQASATDQTAAPARPDRALTRTVLRVEGFSCPSCVTKVERRVARLPGVETVNVHFASARVEVTHDEAATSVDDLVGAVAKAGYRSKPAAF